MQSSALQPSVWICPQCAQQFGEQRFLTRHRGSAACHRRISEIDTVCMATPMPETLGVDAARLRKLKVLALGRWRYMYKLSHNAVSAINEDAQRHTEEVLNAYLQHLPRVLASNGLAMDVSTMAQVKAAATRLLKATDVSEGVKARHAELEAIVSPVRVQAPRVVGHDEDGTPQVVVDMLVEDCLQKMLQDEELTAQVLQPHEPMEGVFKEPRCGSAFSNHPLFRGNPGAFCFQLYAGEYSPPPPTPHLMLSMCMCVFRSFAKLDLTCLHR